VTNIKKYAVLIYCTLFCISISLDRNIIFLNFYVILQIKEKEEERRREKKKGMRRCGIKK
jgi:hypothetical protein